MSLDNFRNEIDEIDNKILELLESRMAIVLKVKEYKIQNNLAVLDTKREGIIYHKIDHLNSEYTTNYKEIYRCIMQESKKIQSKGDNNDLRTKESI